MLYGAAYYPEHRDPGKWEYDLDNMVEANLNCVRVGEFAWKPLEPREGEYDFDWVDRFLGLAAERNIQVMLCPPLRTAPAWLVEKDPSVLTMTKEGLRLEFGSRYTFCINNDTLRSCGMALAERMAQHFGPHAAVTSWHLDNEYGDEEDCHCPVCRLKWQAWLAGRYGRIDELNERWGTSFWGLEFDHFAQVPTPMRTKAPLNPGLWQAWRQFRSDCTVEVIGMHVGALRPHIGGAPITTNFQCLWNYCTDYPEAAKHLDVCGLNYYAGFGEHARDRELGLAVVRACKRRNFWVVETHGGPCHIPGNGTGTPEDGAVARLCAHMVANGVDGIVFFRWRCAPFGAEQHIMSITGYDGRPRHGFDEVKQIGANLRRLAPLLEGTTVQSDVAVMYDFQSRWYLEGESQAWHPPKSLYIDKVRQHHRSVRELGMNCDVVGRESDLSLYRMLIVGVMPMIDDELADRLRAFVEAGGILVWHPYCGFCDMDATIYPRRLHPTLEELLGVDIGNFAATALDRERRFAWEGESYAGTYFHDLPEPHGAEVVAWYDAGLLHGRPAVTVNCAGRGKAILVTTYADDAFYAAFLGHWGREVGAVPLLTSPVPAGVEVAERSALDGRRLLFVLNGTGEAKAVALDRAMHDVWADEPVRVELVMAPYGVRVLTGAK